MTTPSFLLTIDVEDWFQVENLREHCPPHTWDSFELRVERNIHRLLDLLDSIEVASSPSAMSYELSASSPRATFFILGWLAERLPSMVREIQSRGHEVASHGDNHLLCTSQSASELREDLAHSKKKLEDIIGQPVLGYRAPSFSISLKTLELIREAGYVYDSSLNSFAGHGRYGRVDLSPFARNGSHVMQLADGFFELPISNLQIGRRTLPWGGGGYFRLLPLRVYRVGLKHALSQQGVFVFYMHPWEIDPGQPKVRASKFRWFKHYVNLCGMEAKLLRLLQSISYLEFPTCSQYLIFESEQCRACCSQEEPGEGLACS